ncbi:MAG: tetratricopeptide repeat protein [Armatimonadota bacterium]|nr:tetratricopeptide repeat protein [Armatimonadota bacterium]
MRRTLRSAILYVALLAASLLFLFPPIGVCATQEADAEAQYANGADLEALAQYTEAIGAWQTVLAHFSDQKRVCANAKLAIGRAYRALGQIEDAERQFTDLIASYPDFHRQGAEALLELGRILEDKREFPQAIAKYRSVISAHSDMKAQCAKARLRIAACLSASANEDQALEELSAVPRDYPEQRTESAEARIRIGQTLSDKGQADQAIAQFQSAVADCGDMKLWAAEALLGLASAQEKAGVSDDALASRGKVLSDHQDIRPACLKALLARGRIREQTNKAADAISEYQTVLQDYPGFQRQADGAKARIQSLLASADLSADDSTRVQQAITQYDQIRQSAAMDAAEQDLAEGSGVAPDYARTRTDRVNSLTRKGQALRGKGQHEQAITVFRKLLTDYDDTDTWHAQAQIEIGKTHRKAGSLSEALTTLASVSADNPSAVSECADATLLRGQIYEEMGADEDAITEYRNVLKNYSDKKGRSGLARYRVGLLLKKKGKDDDALAEFAQLYTDTTNLPEYVFPALEAAIQTLEPKKKFREAIAAADSAIAGYPEPGRYRARALQLKSMVQCDARRYSDAAATLRNSISQHANDPGARGRARMLLVQSLLMDRKRQDALGVLNEMTAMDGWSREELAFIKEYTSFCYKFSDPARSETVLSEIIENYSDTAVAPDAYFHRAVLRANRGAYEEAISDIQMVNAAHLRHFAMANLCFVQGKYANAAPDYEQVLTSLPADYKGSYCEIVEAAGKLVDCYQKLGENDKSTAAFKRLIELEIERVLPAF